MATLSWLFGLFAILASVSASPIVTHSSYSTKETHHVPLGWSQIGVPNPQHQLTLHIGLKQHRFDELEQHLFQVSDPSHPRYGQHLSKAGVDTLVSPSDETNRLIHDWLFDHNIEARHLSYSSAHDWISITLPVSEVEELLDAKYFVYRHDDGTTLVRTTQWSLPRNLHNHISTIQPTTAFLKRSPFEIDALTVPGEAELPAAIPDNVTGIEAVCNFSAVTTACLRTIYKTLNYIPQSDGKSQIAFTNYLREKTNRSDAAIFLEQSRPEAVISANTYTEISIDNGPISDGLPGAGIEALLDAETILGLVWPLPVTSYSTGGLPPFTPDRVTPTNTNEPYLAWLNYVLAQETLPQVISTSYGDSEQTVPYSYAKAVCDQFAQLGARGITLIFASGDWGIGRDTTCVANDGNNTPSFLPMFPASCPYVTTVGGTMNYPEVVANDPRNGYVSGSGFSNYFSRPTYQDEVVTKYLSSLTNPYPNLFNTSGRAYPDLSAQSVNYLVIYRTQPIYVDGTSASAPTVASIFALLNDALIKAGKPVMGWLNPWLYREGYKAFTDVMQGNSTGCGTTGFPAGPGWDVASGFGSPDFEKLLDVVGLGAAIGQDREKAR